MVEILNKRRCILDNHSDKLGRHLQYIAIWLLS